MNTSYMRQLWTDPEFIRRIGQTPTVGIDSQSQITATSHPQPQVLTKKPVPAKQRVLDSIAIDPAQPKLVVGGLVQFTATVKYSDGSRASTKVVWSAKSDSPRDIVIDPKGLFYAQAGEGSDVTVTATATEAQKSVNQSVQTKVTRGDDPDRASDPSEWIPAKLSIDVPRLLRPFLDSINKSLQPALDAQKTVEDTAASAGVDLENPADAAKAMKSTTSPLTDDQKKAISDKLGKVQDRQLTMTGFMDQMRDTNDQIKIKQTELRDLVRQKLSPEFLANLDKEASDVGTRLEETWDAINVITAVLSTPGTALDQFIHAIAGTDAVKDTIKLLDEQSQEFESMISTQFNELIDVMAKGKKQEISSLYVRRNELADNCSKAIKGYNEACKDLIKWVSSLSGGADSAGDASKGFTKTYAAIIVAAQVSQNTRHRLIGKNPEETFSLGTPLLGELIVNAPPDLLVYERSGKQYVYRESITAIQDLTKETQLLVGKVHAFGEKIDGYLEKWKEAMEE